MITYILHRYIIGNVKIFFFSVIPAKSAKGLLKKLGNRNDLVKIVIRNKTSISSKFVRRRKKKIMKSLAEAFCQIFVHGLRIYLATIFF